VNVGQPADCLAQRNAHAMSAEMRLRIPGNGLSIDVLLQRGAVRAVLRQLSQSAL